MSGQGVGAPRPVLLGDPAAHAGRKNHRVTLVKRYAPRFLRLPSLRRVSRSIARTDLANAKGRIRERELRSSLTDGCGQRSPSSFLSKWELCYGLPRLERQPMRGGAIMDLLFTTWHELLLDRRHFRAFSPRIKLSFRLRLLQCSPILELLLLQ